MDDKIIKSSIGDLVNPFTVHEGLFPDIQEAKFAIRGVLRTYFGNGTDNDEDYLFFKSSVVRFEENPEVDLDFDHRKRIVIFVVKEPKGQNAEEIKLQIRRELALEYAVRASDGRGRTAMSIFRSLDPKAKQTLIENERRREHERGVSDE